MRRLRVRVAGFGLAWLTTARRVWWSSTPAREFEHGHRHGFRVRVRVKVKVRAGLGFGNCNCLGRVGVR